MSTADFGKGIKGLISGDGSGGGLIGKLQQAGNFFDQTKANGSGNNFWDFAKTGATGGDNPDFAPGGVYDPDMTVKGGSGEGGTGIENTSQQPMEGIGTSGSSDAVIPEVPAITATAAPALAEGAAASVIPALAEGAGAGIIGALASDKNLKTKVKDGVNIANKVGK